MAWYQFTHPDDPELDALATRFHLHPLHLEDARSTGERVKVESTRGYTFALLKTMRTHGGESEPGSDLRIAPRSEPGGEPRSELRSEHKDGLRREPGSEMRRRKIILFASHDQKCSNEEKFFIVVADTGREEIASVLRRAEGERDCENPVRLLYLVFDSVVDSYFPVIDALDEKIDTLQDYVVTSTRDLLQDIFAVKRRLVDARRLLVSTRDASMHLQRDSGIPLTGEQQLYLRDLYDHISRLLDTVETQRDLLNNALDIYLTGIANRSTEVMKVLTVLSTITLPALVVSSIYGMNIKGLPFVDNPHAALIVAGMTAAFTVGLLVASRLLRWL